MNGRTHPLRARLGDALPPLGLGFAGLLGGHTLLYALTVSDPRVRTHVLAATGHGYLSRPIAVGIAVAGGCGLLALVRGIRRAAPAGSGGPAVLVRSAVKLAALQAATFVLLELVERIAAGHHAPSPALIALGLAVQVVFAVAAAAVSFGLGRVGELLRRPSRPARAVDRGAWPVGSGWKPLPRSTAGFPVLGRAPPATAV